MSLKGWSYLLPAIFKTFVLPPILTRILINQYNQHSTTRVHPVLQSGLYLTALPLLYVLRAQISIYLSDRAARRAGAKPIPRVQGRFPLNIDVLLDWARSGSEEEVGRMMVLLGRKYGGTYNTRVLGEDQILTTDPRVVKHALVDDFDTFVKGHKTRSRGQEFLGDGIFNADGDRWKFHRVLTRPFFHPTHVSPNLFIPHILSALSSFPLLKASADSQVSDPFDIQQAMGDLSLYMAVNWICGVDLSREHTRGQEWEEARRGVGEAMRVAQGAVGKRVKIGTAWDVRCIRMYPDNQLIDQPLFELRHDPLAAPMRTIRAFFQPLIEEAAARNLARTEEKAHEDDKGEEGWKEKVRLIDRLVQATNDRKLIEDQLINILLASRDTTASLLTFVTYALVLYPEVWRKVRDEALAAAGIEGEITKDTIRECPYSRRVINETLRLFPPVPLNIRRTLHSSLLPTSTGEKLYIPPNTSLVIGTILMQRDRKVWGEDADEFRPERWEVADTASASGVGEGGGEGGNGGIKGREGFAAWNLGPRMCLGQPFALTALHTYLILLVRHLTSMRTANNVKGNHEGESGARLVLAPEAQPEGTKIPDSWIGGDGDDGVGCEDSDTSTKQGDGRGRGGRDRVWIVSDVVLAVKGGLWVKIVK